MVIKGKNSSINYKQLLLHSLEMHFCHSLLQVERKLILNNFEISHDQETFCFRNIVESIESLKDSLAFSRPGTKRNSIGFGFQEFIRVNSLYSDGYVLPEIDTLIGVINRR